MKSPTLHPDLINAVEKIAAAERSRDWKAYERAEAELSRLCGQDSPIIQRSPQQFALALQTYLGIARL